MKNTIFAFLLVTFFSFSIQAHNDTHWPVNKQVQLQKSNEIKELVDYAFDTSVETRKTTAVLVVYKGKILLEAYSPFHNSQSRHPTWSVSKGIVNALVGIAVKEGRLSLADSVCEYGLAQYCEITIESLLHWNSGLDWQEVYEKGQQADSSDVLNMLYRQRGHRNMVSFILDRAMKAAPGANWNYSSGDSNLLMFILKNIYGADYDRLPWVKVFAPLGIQSAVWEQDQQGVFVGSSYAYMSAQDLARFGELYLNDGIAKGHRMLPEGWVKYSAVPPKSMAQKPKYWQLGAVGGAHWWTNRDHPTKSIERPLPQLGEDTMACRGHWGQYLFVVPSHDLLVVRFGVTRTETDEATGEVSFDPREFIRLVMAVVEG